MDGIKNKKRYFTFFSLGLFVGIIMGVVIINFFISYRIDAYIKEIQYLNTIIEEDTVKLQKLKESINNKKLLIRSINVDVQFKDKEQEDEIVKIDLEKHIKQKFNGLIGKEVDKIDGDILYETVNKRIMKLYGREYQLRVTKIVISQDIMISVEAKKI